MYLQSLYSSFIFGPFFNRNLVPHVLLELLLFDLFKCSAVLCTDFTSCNIKAFYICKSVSMVQSVCPSVKLEVLTAILTVPFLPDSLLSESTIFLIHPTERALHAGYTNSFIMVVYEKKI